MFTYIPYIYSQEHNKKYPPIFFYTIVYLTSIPLPYSHSNTPDIYMNKIHAYLHM